MSGSLCEHGYTDDERTNCACPSCLRPSLWDALEDAARDALAALENEIDHYATPAEAPDSTYKALSKLENALSALDARGE